MAGWKGEEVRKIGEGRKTFFGRGKRPRVSSFFLPLFLIILPQRHPPSRAFNFIEPLADDGFTAGEGAVWL